VTQADGYESPLSGRYASSEMRSIFGARRRIQTWRTLWIELARAQRELGLPISDAQLAALERTRDEIDFERAAALERELKHDVMAHIAAWGERCPEAAGVIHLGATSYDIVDNADLVLFREALHQVARGLAATLAGLARFATRTRDLACLGYTHFQAAQPVTVGRRACLWAQDFLDDLAEVERLARGMKLRGARGATGTQASYLALFGGNAEAVRELDRRFVRACGFERSYAVASQTYPRKLDSKILAALSGVAESAAKMATDIRLLSGTGELLEPRDPHQVGSSAMPYKRNPMKSERICGLARFVLGLATNPPATASAQWLERSLDDSANRRLVLPEAFLATDAILRVCGNVVRGLEPRPTVIARRLAEMMPFFATEDVMMDAAKAGGHRGDLHEALRVHALAAWEAVESGRDNDLLARLAADPKFAAARARIQSTNRPEQYVGLAREQVDAFLERELRPALAAYPEAEQWETGLAV